MKKVIVGTILIVAVLAMFFVAGTPQEAEARVEYFIYSDPSCASGVGLAAYEVVGGQVYILGTMCMLW